MDDSKVFSLLPHSVVLGRFRGRWWKPWVEGARASCISGGVLPGQASNVAGGIGMVRGNQWQAGLETAKENIFKPWCRVFVWEPFVAVVSGRRIGRQVAAVGRER